MSKATEVKYDDYGKHFNIYMVLGKTHKLSFRTNWRQSKTDDTLHFLKKHLISFSSVIRKAFVLFPQLVVKAYRDIFLAKVVHGNFGYYFL
ncbi:MAG TPA: hypothetical protein DEP00_02500 [Lachnospiraceae bacterium]|nr:hypothetical protein [Lachnospiraceae bacterium]